VAGRVLIGITALSPGDARFQRKGKQMKLNVSKQGKRGGFTIVEMVTAMAIAGITVAGVASGFMQVFMQGQSSAYSLAAHSQAMRGLEQARAAKWDPLASPPKDDLGSDTNWPPMIEILDLPQTGNNITYATNRVSIKTISSKPPLRQIKVECTWSFLNRRVFTNSIVTYRAPDQ
jgi:prepilin-type N-terminal cleavage/methylation domain-containing protein